MKKENYISPVNINEDVWFYPTPKGFDFVVWTTIGNERKATIFRLTHKKIAKFLS